MKQEQVFQGKIVKHYGLLLIEGSLAGLIATIPMTLFMLAMQYLLPKWQQYALPPEKFTDTFAKQVGLKKHMSKSQLLLASLISHLGFGGAMGAIYGLLTRIIPLPSILKGSIFGIVVWSTAYLGWLPLIGMSEATTREPIQRNTLMITAHLIWGTVMGGMIHPLERVFESLIQDYPFKKAS